MKLKDLNEQARRQNFDMRRIQRIHSSLYRLASSSGNEPIYFTSKWGALYGYLYGLDDACISGYTSQWSFYGQKVFTVYQF